MIVGSTAAAQRHLLPLDASPAFSMESATFQAGGTITTSQGLTFSAAVTQALDVALVWVLTRSPTLTVPAGFTLLSRVAVEGSGVVQTLSVYYRVLQLTDINKTFTWTQAPSGRMQMVSIRYRPTRPGVFSVFALATRSELAPQFGTLPIAALSSYREGQKVIAGVTRITESTRAIVAPAGFTHRGRSTGSDTRLLVADKDATDASVQSGNYTIPNAPNATVAMNGISVVLDLV